MPTQDSTTGPAKPGMFTHVEETMDPLVASVTEMHDEAVHYAVLAERYRTALIMVAGGNEISADTREVITALLGKEMPNENGE